METIIWSEIFFTLFCISILVFIGWCYYKCFTELKKWGIQQQSQLQTPATKQDLVTAGIFILIAMSLFRR